MTALARARSLDQVAAFMPPIQIGVDGGSTIYMGAMVTKLTATGYAVPAGTASSDVVYGVALHDADNAAGGDGALSVNIQQGIFKRTNSGTAALTQAYFGEPCYAEDDQVVRNAGAANYPLAGICLGIDADGKVIVAIGAMWNYLLSQGALAAALVAVTDALGASMIGLEDDANLTTQTNCEEAIQELEQDAVTALATIPIPIPAFVDVTGAPLLVFNGGGTTVPGLTLDNSKQLSMRWNNNGTHTQVLGSFVVPADMDLTANATVVVHCSKTGATNNAGNTTTFDVAAYNQVVGALHDADTNYGGTTSAVAPAATSKTIQEVTLALAAADLPAAGSGVTLLMKPTAGTLDTDDISVNKVCIKYKRKYRTS